MRVIALIDGAHGVLRILEHLGRWAPEARGSPAPGLACCGGVAPGPILAPRGNWHCKSGDTTRDFAKAFRWYQDERYLRNARAQVTARYYGNIHHATGVARNVRNGFLGPKPGAQRSPAAGVRRARPRSPSCAPFGDCLIRQAPSPFSSFSLNFARTLRQLWTAPCLAPRLIRGLGT